MPEQICGTCNHASFGKTNDCTAASNIWERGRHIEPWLVECMHNPAKWEPINTHKDWASKAVRIETIKNALKKAEE